MIRMLIVLAAFAGAFIVLPYFVLPRPRGARSILDAVSINLVRWMAIVIVGTHVMVVLGIYEMLAVVALCLVALYFARLRPAGWDLAAMKEFLWDKVLRSLNQIDTIEQNVRWSRRNEYIVTRLRLVPPPPEGIPPRSPLRLALLATIPIGVIGASFWMRASFAMSHVSLSPPDVYHHMAWAKGLIGNEIFADGVYPYGLATLLAFVNKFNGLAAMLDVTRFMGPIIGTLVVYGLFYCVYRLTGNAAAATFAAGVFGLLGARPEWHEPWFRQTGALPQELALAIGLLALPSAVMAVVDRERDHLWTVGAASVAIGMTHPMPLPVYVLLAAVGALVAAAVGGGFRHALETVGVAVAGAFAGLAYIPLARFAGLGFFDPIDNLTPLAGPGEDPGRIVLSVGELGYKGLASFAVPALILGAVAGVVVLLAHDGRRRSSKLLAACAIGTVIAILYDVGGLNLDPYYANRLAQVVGPQLAIAFGIGFAALTALIPKDRSVTAFAALLVAVLGLGAVSHRYPAYATPPETVEYESVTRVTLDISDRYERFTYTVVGTPQQRQVVLGDGWFIEAWVFARDATLRGARDPGYQMMSRKGVSDAQEPLGLIGIPTQDVFIFVEKVPFDGPQLKADGPTEEYYFDPDKRGRIMASIYHWSELYLRYHTDMTVYYEDEQIKVYRISRAPDASEAADVPEFKDYTWVPGELFTSGPKDPARVKLP